MAQPTPIATPNTPLGQADPAGYEAVKLTPPLVMIISLLFMIASDGDIDAAESSQIQSVIGQNEPLVRFASDYVRTVALSDFLSRAKEGLSPADRLCITGNVFDAMLSDGVVKDIEHTTFESLRTALEIRAQDFASFDKTLRLKNNRAVLGVYDAEAARAAMTPHLALAVSILYMMSADGSIDQHEIGRLEALVADFQGLERLAVAYVKATPRDRFFQEALLGLDDTQKLFILLNVYDTLTADGIIAVSEDKIFQSMLSAFRLDADVFAPHAAVLECKNLKPFDLRKVDIGQLLPTTLRTGETITASGSASSTPSVGEVVSRTIQENLATTAQSIGSAPHIAQIQTNAMGQLNLQQVESGAIVDSHQQIPTDAFGNNHQTIDDSTFITNRQDVSNGAIRDTRAMVAHSSSETNRQSLDPFALRKTHLAVEIESLHDQLIRFEHTHKTWLSMGKDFSALTLDEVLSLHAASPASDAMPPQPPPTTQVEPRRKVTPSPTRPPALGVKGVAPQAGQVRFSGVLLHGRVKAWCVALSFAMGVSNLSVLQAKPQREAYGVLTSLTQPVAQSVAQSAAPQVRASKE